MPTAHVSPSSVRRYGPTTGSPQVAAKDRADTGVLERP
jgi:hypothetical protein